jgi:hypothetical protein
MSLLSNPSDGPAIGVPVDDLLIDFLLSSGDWAGGHRRKLNDHFFSDKL